MKLYYDIGLVNIKSSLLKVTDYTSSELGKETARLQYTVPGWLNILNFPGYPTEQPKYGDPAYPSPLKKGMCIDAMCDCSAFMKNVLLNYWGLKGGFNSPLLGDALATESFLSLTFKTEVLNKLGVPSTFEMYGAYPVLAGASKLMSAVGSFAVAYSLY